MRKVIAAMKLSIDSKIEGSEGIADWVEAWSDDYGLTPQIDACLLGGGMYPGYEQYWSGIHDKPETPVIRHTPHYVLSTTLNTTSWSNTTFLRDISQVTALKQQPGKDIYLVGGGRVVAGLLDAGLVDELRLISYPLIAGDGTALFATAAQRRPLDLRSVTQLPAGKISLVYAVH